MNVLDFIAVTEIYLDHVVDLPVLRTLLLERFARLTRVLKLCKLKSCASAVWGQKWLEVSGRFRAGNG